MQGRLSLREATWMYAESFCDVKMETNWRLIKTCVRDGECEC